MITEWFRYCLQLQDFMKVVYLSKWEYITQVEAVFTAVNWPLLWLLSKWLQINIRWGGRVL
jgi:hypothetical protein